jgi:hypothetical protein
MLQYRILHYAEFAPTKLAQLNTALDVTAIGKGDNCSSRPVKEATNAK